MPGAVVTRAPGLRFGTLGIAKAAAGGTAAAQLCVPDLCAGIPVAVACRAAASLSASRSDKPDLPEEWGSRMPDVVVGCTAATAYEDDDVCGREIPCALLVEIVVWTTSNKACTSVSDVGSPDLLDVAGGSLAAVSNAVTGPDVGPPGASAAAADLGLAVDGSAEREPRDERVGCKLRSELAGV